MPYIFHVSILIASCYLFYRFLLGRETFFQFNRWVLVACLFLSFSLPFLEIPQEWSLKNQIAEEPIAQYFQMPSPQKMEIPEMEKNALEEEIAIEEISTEVAPEIVKESKFSNLTFFGVLKFIYLTGLAIFALNFLLQLMVLLVKIIRNPSIRDGRFRIVELTKDKAPFSFWNYIFLNPTKYDWDTYNQILAHEKIHVSQKHTLDILIAEVLVVLQWFNPFAWYYRKAVEHNLEYLTDQEMLATGNDATSYQMNLLKVAVPNIPLNLTTNYNQSILKKRILMMNAKKSSVRSSWKYFFILPLLGFSIICLNAVKTTAQQPESTNLEDSNQSVLEEVLPQIEGEKSTEPVIIRTGGYEIINTGEQQYMHPLSAMEGKWEGKLDGNNVCFHFKREYEGDGHYWVRKACFSKNSIGNLPTGSKGDFKLSRAAGTISFNGVFSDNKGTGTYKFEESADFRKFLEGQGLEKVDDRLLFNCFLTDIDKAYFDYLKKAGYKEITTERLMALAVHNLSQERIEYYVTNLKSMGYAQPTIDEIVGLEIHDVEMDYVKALSENIEEKLTIENIIGASIHDVDAAYIKEFKAAGFDDLTFDNLVGFAIHEVDVDYIKALKSAGLDDLTPDQITGAAIHDVDAEYIKAFQAAGFKDLTFDNLVGFAIHDIDVDFIEALKAGGLDDLTPDQITAAGIHDVDADYIKAFQSAGFENLDFDDLVGFAIHDVDLDLIKSLQAGGLGDLTADQITAAAIHDVDADYIKAFQSAGFEDLDFDDLVGFAIHEVDIDFIKALQAGGLGDLTSDQITAAAIHDVDADYIKAFQAAGFEDLDFDNLVGFAIHDVDVDYIKSLKTAGLTDLSADDITGFAIHDVDADFINGFKKHGYTDMSNEEIVGFAIHDVNAEFIQSIKGLGFKDASAETLTALRIHDVDAAFIKKARADGHTNLSLEEYLELKIKNDRRRAE